MSGFRTIPRAMAFDHTLALGREGYNFISTRCEQLGTDIFETRLLLRRVICMRGAAAAEIFYAGDRFTRVGAMPTTAVKLLQDYESVQLLDGAAHRRRKHMFLSIGSPSEAMRLASLFANEWHRSLARWEVRRASSCSTSCGRCSPARWRPGPAFPSRKPRWRRAPGNSPR
jgi:fatty-acid peroxygenase